MTSEAREASWDQGQPVHFFRFTRENIHWFYTSSEYFETLNGDTYTPAAIARSAIRQGTERAKNSIKVTLPSNLPVANNWRPYTPNQTIALTIFVRHVGEADAMAEWVGRVVSPSFDGAVLTLTCEPSQTRGRRQGIQRFWQRPCGLELYSQGLGKCNLNPAAIPVAATLTGADGVTLTAAEFAAAPRSLAGGRLEWNDGTAHQVAITGHDGSSITVATAPGLAVGASVTAFTSSLSKPATLTVVSGLTLTADAFGEYFSGRLAGGYIEWLRADGLMEFRTIRRHVGNTIDIDYGAEDLAVGLVVTVYPGCAHTWADCSYYENEPNFGGDLWIRTQNPFSGNPVT
ncbi:phage BR0599 family protein [Pseudomonas sp. 273]|uniref:phage BR0599 family protein n=1 Tax=Pseudomonas sp. 273 TaxID=75692 RepID=UPI0023D87668|nr:phage BR0599 family protein [Pseudomonas sp. 273]